MKSPDNVEIGMYGHRGQLIHKHLAVTDPALAPLCYLGCHPKGCTFGVTGKSTLFFAYLH